MMNQDIWLETKFIMKNGTLKANKNTKHVSLSSRLMVNLIGDYYQENISKHVSGLLLDLGCGSVPLYEAYKPFIKDNICVDWQNSMHKNNFLDLSADLNLPLPIESDKFDTIILSDVLEHIKNPKILWSELNRVIKKDGKIIINTPFYYWIHEEPYDFYRHTEFSLKDAAEQNGFKILSFENIGGVFEILTDLYAKLFRFIPVIGKPISILIQKISFWFYKTSIGKKIALKSSKKFPYAYGMVIQKI